MKMKMVYASFKVKYNTYDRFELESKPGREAGKARRVLAWFFISAGMGILFGLKGWNLSINGVPKYEHPENRRVTEENEWTIKHHTNRL